MQIISSKDNTLIKHIKKLKDKKYRDENNEFIIEGIKLIKEAIQENSKIKQIVICEDCENSFDLNKDLIYEIAKENCIYVTKKVFETITDVTNPQGILAIIEKNNYNKTSKDILNEINLEEDIIVALDGVQDPGNLGTILRTVDSIGLTQILVSKETADSYNPKVVRSTMGAIFRIKIIECENLEETLNLLKQKKYSIMVTSLQTNNSIYDINFNKTVVVIGNEANGVTEKIQKIADKKAKIPMLGKTESLNASVATGIVLYEYVRQKIQNKKGKNV